MQYVEGLADRQAADAVRSRIDWKYALNLELTDPGFDFSILSEFRARLLGGSAEQILRDAFLHKCRERKLLKARGRRVQTTIGSRRQDTALRPGIFSSIGTGRKRPVRKGKRA